MGQTQTRKQKILGDVKKARRRRILISTTIIVVLAVSIVAAIIFLTPHTPPNPLIGTPISPTMQNYLTGVTNTTLAAVGSGSSQNVYSMSSKSVPQGSFLTSGTKPEFLYVGAEFCPFCAAERWSMIVALSKFGNFTGLEYMLSADSPESYADTPTFTFIHATYSSSYVSFVSKELYDRSSSHNPLQSLSSNESSLVNAADCYQGQCGGLAFVDIANQWVMGTQSSAGSQFSPGILDGIGNWTQIGSQLNTPSFPVAQAVDGAANYLIKAICSIDGNRPGSVCNQSYLGGLTQAPVGVTNMPPAATFNMIVTPDSRFDEALCKDFL